MWIDKLFGLKETEAVSRCQFSSITEDDDVEWYEYDNSDDDD